MKRCVIRCSLVLVIAVTQLLFQGDLSASDENLNSSSVRALELVASYLVTGEQEGSAFRARAVMPQYQFDEDCRLNYQFSLTEHTDVTSDDLPVSQQQWLGRGQFLAGEVSFRAGSEPGQIAVVPESIFVGDMVWENRLLPGSDETLLFLAPDLEVSEGALIERVGPTNLWSGYPDFIGLNLFWPGLSSSARPGTAYTWSRPQNSHRAEVRERIVRGIINWDDDRELPDFDPILLDESVEVVGWVAVSGQPAVVLEATSRIDSQIEIPGSWRFGISRKVVGRQFRGVYLVSGRGELLSAWIQQTMNYSMGVPGFNERIEVPISRILTGTAYLHDRCGEPVIQAPDTAHLLSAQESAISLQRSLLDAVDRRSWLDLEQTLAAELLNQHGSDDMMTTLRHHLGVYGPNSLGEITRSTHWVEEDDHMRVVLEGAVQNPVSQQRADFMSTQTVWEFRQIEGEWRVWRIVSRHGDESSHPNFILNTHQHETRANSAAPNLRHALP